MSDRYYDRLETDLDRAVDDAISEANERAMNPETVRCETCGRDKEPTLVDGLYYVPGTTFKHRCDGRVGFPGREGDNR